MISINSNNSDNIEITRKSQNILQGLVYKQPESIKRAGSLPNKSPVPNNTKSPIDDKRSKSVFNTTLSQIGLPEDTFDKILIMTDKKLFRKRVMQLINILSQNQQISLSERVDLRKLHQCLKRDYRKIEINELNKQMNIKTKQKHYSQTDQEVYEITHRKDNNSNNDCFQSNPNLNNLTKSPQFRSSSNLLSKIPTPIKSPLVVNERPLSKMEMRIQRRQSLSNTSSSTDALNIRQQCKNARKYSIDASTDIVQFQEEF